MLATIGLTLILSLGLVLRPVQEYGVGPKQVLHILVYFMPITLTFVLPMAALFASSLAYGRFASDNELNACRASGISLWVIVYPGLALAILVAIANLLLSFHVMPYFVHLAERSLKTDAKQILFRNLQRRGFYELPSMGGGPQFRLYADYADAKNDTLYGIVAVRSRKRSITEIYTAERTTVNFDLHENANEVQLSVYNSRVMGGAGGFSVSSKYLLVRQPFGSLLGDDIKYKKINEMKRIREDLMLFDPIAELARSAYLQFVTEVLAEDIRQKLSHAGTSYYEMKGPALGVRFSAAACELREEQTISLVGPIVVEEYDARSGQLLRRLRSDNAAVHVGDEIPNPRLGLDLPSARTEADQSLEALHIIRDLTLPDGVLQQMGQGSLLQRVLPEQSRKILPVPSSLLAEAQRKLESEITGTLLDIKAEMNSRLVFGIGCIPMILIGIGLGIINRGGHLLSAFGASCAPAAILIIAIISGRQVAGNAGAQVISGVAIMWAGLTFLVFVTVFIYRRLLRT